jgi:hypothetical protein
MSLGDRRILAGQRPSAERARQGAPVPAACGRRDKMILAAGSLLMILEALLWLGSR